jgi:hypothetical protein
MNRLLGHGAAQNFSPSRRGLVHGRAEQKTSECGYGTRLFLLRSAVERGSGSPVNCVAGKRRNHVVLARVSLVLSHLFLGHCFGAYATPGGRLALLLCYAPSGLRFPPSADPP